jgi:hypothetical protein
MAKEKVLEQPDKEAQDLLNDIVEDSVDEVILPGTKKSYSISWLKRGTIRKITDITSGKEDGEDDKISCKVSAAIILNGYWKIKLWYGLLWRWLYYIKQYNDEQLAPLIEVGKKKVPVDAFYLTTISVIGMRDTMMAMTKAEVERILQEHHTEQPTH